MGVPFAQAFRSPFMLLGNPPDQVTAGKKSTFKIPVGQTYLEFALFCTIAGVAATRAQIEAGIDRVVFKMNGTEVADLTGEQWSNLAEFYRANSVADNKGFLPFFCERPWMQELINQRSAAWGTVGQSSFTMEVYLNGATTIDDLALFYRVHPVAEPLGRHVELRSISHTFAATGDDRVIDLPYGDSRDVPDSLLAIHIKCTKANLAKMRLIADKVDVFQDLTVPALEKFYGAASDHRNPQTGYVSIDFMNRNWQADELPLSMNFLQLVLTWQTAAPGTFPIVLEIATGQAGQTKGSG